MRNRRTRILQAASEAARIRDRFPMGRRTSFDIVRAINELGIPILFRPTEDLLGATVTLGEETRGIIITTKRSLATQRFTLAHELGHIVLGHDMRFHLLDDEIPGLVPGQSHPHEEHAAMVFASEVLASRPLISEIATRHSWDTPQLREPATIYQLSVRLGLSFQATCWALASQNIIQDERARRLAGETEVNQLKSAIVSPYVPADPWADVWSLKEADVGSLLEAGPNDTFVVDVREKASSGFIWEPVESDRNFEIVSQKTDFTNSYGDDSTHVLLFRSRSPGNHRLIIQHRRPWSGERLATLEFSIVNFGKEVAGLPRTVKRELLNAS